MEVYKVTLVYEKEDYSPAHNIQNNGFESDLSAKLMESGVEFSSRPVDNNGIEKGQVGIVLNEGYKQEIVRFFSAGDCTKVATMEKIRGLLKNLKNYQDSIKNPN